MHFRFKCVPFGGSMHGVRRIQACPSAAWGVCPHTTTYVYSYYYICVLILLHMCPHTTFVSLRGD